MNDHSKLIGYVSLGILVIVVVAWGKYGAVSDTILWAALIATVSVFIGFASSRASGPKRRAEMTKSTPPAGTKRKCISCGAKFYDLNRQPVVCPKCNTELAEPAAIIS